MPPMLMLIAVIFVLLMVAFGNNPVDQWRAEREKYGNDPIARQINKFNEENAKKGMTKYTPPEGSTTYRLPPDQAQIPPANLFDKSRDAGELVRPAPDVPVSEWNNQYPSYMMAPNTGLSAPGNNIVPPREGGTSLVPGGRR